MSLAKGALQDWFREAIDLEQYHAGYFGVSCPGAARPSANEA